MSELRAEIVPHLRFLSSTACCLCGASHDQQLVSVTLFRGGVRLGDVCPRCVAATPATFPPLAEVVASERRLMRERFPELRAEDLSRLVDARYQDVLPGPST